MRTVILLFLLILFALLVSCQEGDQNTNGPSCPPFDIVFSSPYSDPVWHPSGEFIGFNYTPLKRITYTYGYDCPNHAEYLTEPDSVGFYLVNADGSNERMVLPFKINTPAWSPAGEWIAFHRNRNIYKMYFENGNFDTSNIIQLTFDGVNTYPTWSRDGKWIAYNNNNCGSATKDPPKDECGILIMDKEGNERFYLGKAGQPNWSPDGNYIGCIKLFDEGRGIAAYNIEDSVFHSIFLLPNNTSLPGGAGIKYTWDGSKLGFLMQTPDHNLFSGTTLYVVKSLGPPPKQIAPFTIFEYDWGPNNQIVYQNFDYSRIDEEQGTLWVMNEDGTEQRQLTFHQDLEIIIP